MVGVCCICFLEYSILDTTADEKFAEVVAKEKPMSARRRRRSNSNSKDEANGGYSDYSLSSTSSPMTMSSMSLPPPVSSAGEIGCRDRTHEFRSITMSMRSNQVMQSSLYQSTQ